MIQESTEIRLRLLEILLNSPKGIHLPDSYVELLKLVSDIPNTTTPSEEATSTTVEKKKVTKWSACEIDLYGAPKWDGPLGQVQDIIKMGDSIVEFTRSYPFGGYYGFWWNELTDTILDNQVEPFDWKLFLEYI